VNNKKALRECTLAMKIILNGVTDRIVSATN